MSPERVDWHLWNWAQWHEASTIEVGYESRASGGMGGTSTRAFDAMLAEVDARCAYAVEASVDELPPAQRAAVYHRHLHAVYSLRVPIDQAYADACLLLGRALDRRGIV